MTAGHRTLALYVLVSVTYITVGVFVPQLLLSWVEGAGALLLGVWLVPALLRRRR